MLRSVDVVPEAPFVLEKSYFGRARFEGVEECDGLRMHFAGWLQHMESYMERWLAQREMIAKPVLSSAG